MTLTIIALCACWVLNVNGFDIPFGVPIILGVLLWGQIILNFVKFASKIKEKM